MKNLNQVYSAGGPKPQIKRLPGGGAQSFTGVPQPQFKEQSNSWDDDFDMGDTDECVAPQQDNGGNIQHLKSAGASNINSNSKRSTTPHQQYTTGGGNINNNFDNIGGGTFRASNLDNIKSPLLSNRKDQSMPPSDNKYYQSHQQNNYHLQVQQEQPPYQIQYSSNQNRPQPKQSMKSSVLMPSTSIMNHNTYDNDDGSQQQHDDNQYQYEDFSDNQQPYTQMNSNQQTHKKSKQQQQQQHQQQYQQRTSNYQSQQQTNMKPSRSQQNIVVNSNNAAGAQSNYQYQTAPTVQSDDPETDHDFNRAYMKLVKKVYDEQGNNILITNEELEKAQYNQQYLSVGNFNKRNQQCLENKMHKTKLLAEMKQQAEMVECTFKPQTYSQKQKRNFDQFLKDQAQFEEQKKKKIQERYEINMNMQQQELKLQPQVNKKSARMVEMKKKQIKDEMVSTLDSNNNQILTYHTQDMVSKPVYERLHNINQEKMQKQLQKAMEYNTNNNNGGSHTRNKSKTQQQLKKTRSEAMFQNQLQSQRDRNNGKTVDEMLYEDAKRRQDKQQQKKKDLQKLQEEQINSTRPPTGNNNSKFAAQKFEKEFYFMTHQVLNELGHKHGEEESQDFNLRDYDDRKINYVKLGQLMTELGYIPANIAPDSIERELLFDMWNLLQGEENNGIIIINLKKFLLSVQGICLDNLVANHSNFMMGSKQDIVSEKPNQIQLNNFDDYGVVRISQHDSRLIFVRFKPLYVNRVYFQGQFKRIKYVDNSCTFRPQISKVTEQLAMQKRIRMLSENRYEETVEDGQMYNQMNTNHQDTQKVDLVQILLHPANADQQQWRQQAKQLLEAKEMEECTFKPKINSYDGNTTKSKSGIIATDKCLELYLKGKIMREKRDKTRDDFEFEKGADQCTFQPNIEESQKTLDQLYFSSNKITDSNFFGPNNDDLTQDPTSTIPGYQLVMNRMKKGREDREKVKAMHQRGIPGTVTDESLLQPLHITSNPSYKGAFSTYSHHPDTIVNNHNSANNQTTQSYSSTQKIKNSKSSESLNSQKPIQNGDKTQNFTKTQYNSQNLPQYKFDSKVQQQSMLQSLQSIQEKENINNSNGSLGGINNHTLTTHTNNNNSSVGSSSGIFGVDKSAKYENNRSNTVVGHHNSTKAPVLQNNGRLSRFSDQVPDQQHSDLSYDDEKKLMKGNGFQSMPSDTDPDHSTFSKITSTKQPLLYVDVNLGPGKSERIVVYEGDTAESLADKFALNHGLDMNMRGKLANLLDSQIAGLLEKIEEEQNSIHSDNI